MSNVHHADEAVSKLETRVENRKRELISEIIEHKKNSSRPGASKEVDRLSARLSELAHIVKADRGGWTNLGRATRLRLDEWMTR